MQEKIFGILIVSLICFLLSFSGCIEDNKVPLASISIVSNPPLLNTTIFAESMSVDQDGTITNTTWFLNGDVISFCQNVSFKLNTNGTYILKLLVIDDDGASDSDQRTIVIGETDENSNIKDILIGTWQNHSDGQTGIWTFYQNNTLNSTWRGEYGASVIDYWEYSINGSMLCFFKPSDTILEDACYNLSFSDDYTILIVTYRAKSAEWVKINESSPFLGRI